MKMNLEMPVIDSCKCTYFESVIGFN